MAIPQNLLHLQQKHLNKHNLNLIIVWEICNKFLFQFTSLIMCSETSVLNIILEYLLLYADKTELLYQLKLQLHHAWWRVSGTPARRGYCRCLQPCSSARRRHLLWSESGSLRLSHLRGLPLPTSSTPTSPAVVGLQLVRYTRLRRCEFTDWLLQHCSCWCIKDSNGQVTACVERCCACRYNLLALESLIAAWVRYCITNFTGSTSQTGCFSSWQWQFTGVWTAAHRSTCRTTAFRPPVLTLGGTCVPPTVNYLQCLATGSPLTAVGPFQLPAP